MSVPMEFLRGIPYFAGLPDRELERVRPVVKERSYDRGEMVILEGEPCRAIYFVKAGRVKVFKTSPEGKEQILHIMQVGETFNEVPVFDGDPNVASAAAMDPSDLYLIATEDMQQLMHDLPRVSSNVIRVLAHRLRHMVELVEDLSFRQVSARVAKILLQQVVDGGATDGAGRLTQQQMATMAGTAREMDGRALKGLEQAGAIRMEKGRIVVLDRAALERLA